MPSRQEFLFHLDRPQRVALFITETGWRLQVGASGARPGDTPGAAGGLPVDKGALIAEIAARDVALTAKSVCRLAALHERSGECWALCLEFGVADVRCVVDLSIQQLEEDRAGRLWLTGRGAPDTWVAAWGSTGPRLQRPDAL